MHKKAFYNRKKGRYYSFDLIMNKFARLILKGAKLRKKSKFFIMIMVSVIFVPPFILNAWGIAFADNTNFMIGENTFEIGFDTKYLDYEEDGYMEEDGWMYGIVGKYIYHENNGLMFKTSLSIVFGETDYDGQTQSGTPVKADTDDWIFEWRALIGKDYRLTGGSLLTPFTGIGYRYWNNDIDASGGYEREIQYWYLPIGVKSISPLIKNWTWGVSMEYDLFLSGKIKSHISDIHPKYNDPENDQDFGDGYGVRFSLQFNSKISDSLGFSIEPYIIYWDIDESDTSTWTEYGMPITYVVEPENDTTIYGLRLTIPY